MAQCESVEVIKEECEIIKNVLEVELPEYVELDERTVLETATGKKLSKLLKRVNKDMKNIESVKNGEKFMHFRQYAQF